MKYHLNSNYDKYPHVNVDQHIAVTGWDKILKQWENHLAGKENAVVVIDCYPGVYVAELEKNIRRYFGNAAIFSSEQALMSPDAIQELVHPFVTDHPVFGKMNNLKLDEFFDPLKLKALSVTVQQQNGLKFIIGIGAALVVNTPDLLVYADMPRWEIQLRFRAKRIGNIGAHNESDSFSYKYKRAFFVDWRATDRHKQNIDASIQYWLDTTLEEQPKMITQQALKDGLQAAVNRPFRVVPFFDPGPWGGQWLKKVCDLEDNVPNYAWAFDCVPEENSLLLRFGTIDFEIPSINLVHQHPEELLGKKVYEAFGASFPIRFDFLDTMEGGNLSLQVHPLKEYIKEHFGMPFTQDESYYMMDAKEGAVVYLGLKDDANPDDMIRDLEKAYDEAAAFDADKYVAVWNVKPHDHFLIPSGTVHCSGADSVVLEISATPYIFTFKLYDWERMGLDGKPRPISIDHGKKAIQWDRREDYVKNHLINQFVTLSEGEGWKEERTGLYEGFFIETRRYWMNTITRHDTGGVVNVLNLVEGRSVIVESEENAFEPYVIHYAETFIVPANVGKYTIRPYGESEGRQCGVLKAFINTENLTMDNG